MTTYLSSSRPAKWQRGRLRVVARSQSPLFRSSSKPAKPETTRLSSGFKLVNTAQSSTRFLGLVFKNSFKLPKQEDSFSLPAFKSVNTAQSTYSLNSGFYLKSQPRISLVKSFVLTKDVYRHFEGYPCFTYNNSPKWAVTIGDLKALNQDENYFIVSKLELDGLDKSENNSAEEILAALLLHWQQGKLESRKISVVFYRTLRFKLDSGWVETQSFLINALVNNSVSHFPSPKSFLF